MAIDVNELLAPIAGSDPAGSDASFSGQFDRIREARRADDPSLGQGDWQTELKVADWREAQKLSEDVLRNTSKDLQAAVWLAEAAIGRYGLEGARDGFDLLTGLLDGYWDSLYPREDGDDVEERASKLAWFATYGTRVLQTMLLNDDAQAPLTLAGWIDSREVDNIARQNGDLYEEALSEGRINGETFDAQLAKISDALVRERCDLVQAAREAFARFSAMSDAKMGREAPNLATMDDALKKIQTIYTRLAAGKGLAGVSGAEAAAVADGGGESGVSVSSGGGVAAASGVAINLAAGSLASKEAALRALGEIAGFFRRTEPHSPVAYLLDRAVSWANMPLEQWLAEVVRDESTLSSIRERVGLPPSD